MVVVKCKRCAGVTEHREHESGWKPVRNYYYVQWFRCLSCCKNTYRPEDRRTANGKRAGRKRRREPLAGRLREYECRDARLRILGYESYEDYRNSGLWEDIRTAQLEDQPECAGCDGSANEVHHSGYSLATLNGDTSDQLHSVCRSCHQECEYTEDGAKLTPVEATAKLLGK